tara:strand:- start:1176 stop:1751 length:576 start_codon:yes stop_codon:yes gene_type:complete
MVFLTTSVWGAEPQPTGSSASSGVEGETEKLPEGMRLGQGDTLEVFVDLKGSIYQRRRYQGIVPRVNDNPAFSEKVSRTLQQQGARTQVSWIGYQQLAEASRVFIKTDRLSVFTAYYEKPLKVVIEFPGATIPLKNNARQLDTEHFNSPVSRVRIVNDKKSKSVKVVVDLKRTVGYIYQQDGPYVLIDFER